MTMFDELTSGIDEILLARLDETRIEIPVQSISELLQLRQKFYVRAKKIRLDCEKSGIYGRLYQAASTFTATPDKEGLKLIINDRSHIVGTSSIKSVLAKLGRDYIKDTNIKINSETLLEDIKEVIEGNIKKDEEAKVNPFYDRNTD